MNRNPLIPQDNSLDGKRDDPAVELIRAKVERAIAHQDEPDAGTELAEAKNEHTPSKHQRYMQELSGSGKSLADIQTEWHHYYIMLPDAEKREVWEEFYEANQHTPYQKLFQKQQAIAGRKREEATAQPVAPARPLPNGDGIVVANHEPAKPEHKHMMLLANNPTAQKLKSKVNNSKVGNAIGSKMNAGNKLKVKHHLQSLAFGLASGFVVLVVLLFTFFNEYIIAPFIQPGRRVSDAPIILSDDTTTLNAPPSVTIPKINVQIPLDFNVQTTDENAIEAGLKTGVVHYSSTVMPGQNGNAAYFGHSAVNIFNNGEKYGFAFTLLHDLTTGDVFYITYSGKTYAYRIFDRQIVPPSDVGVINETEGKQATATLITCDPPGVSTNRLVVWGEQISPVPSTNTNPVATTAVAAPASLAGNGPTLWSKFIGSIEFWK